MEHIKFMESSTASNGVLGLTSNWTRRLWEDLQQLKLGLAFMSIREQHPVYSQERHTVSTNALLKAIWLVSTNHYNSICRGTGAVWLYGETPALWDTYSYSGQVVLMKPQLSSVCRQPIAQPGNGQWASWSDTLSSILLIALFKERMETWTSDRLALLL